MKAREESLSLPLGTGGFLEAGPFTLPKQQML